MIHYKEVILTGSQNATIDQYRRVLELMPHMGDLHQIVTNSFTIDDSPKAYESRLAMDGLKSEVVFPGVGAN